jgi:hypothetical protein
MSLLGADMAVVAADCISGVVKNIGANTGISTCPDNYFNW